MRRTVLSLALLIVQLCAIPATAATLRDKYRGVILGSYLGDAIGKGVEFRYAKALQTAPLSYRQRNVRRFAERSMDHLKGQERNHAIGTYTDDTEEAIAVLDALIAAKGRFEVNVLAQKLLYHFHRSHGYSASTQALLESFAKSRTKDGAPYDALKRRDAFFAKMPAKKCRDSNGCSMRSAAMGLKLASLRIKSAATFRRRAYASCELTHPAPAAMEGAALIMKAIEYALRRSPRQFKPEEFFAMLVQFNASAKPRIMPGTPAAMRGKVVEDFNSLRRNLKKVQAFYLANPGKPVSKTYLRRELTFLRNEIGVGVKNSTSVASSLYLAARYHESYRLAINATLHVSLAGDTDTLPAMVGAIIGALHGARSFPQVWMRQLYTGDARWKKIARYRRNHHEPLQREDGRPRYLSWKKVCQMADQLYALVERSKVSW